MDAWSAVLEELQALLYPVANPNLDHRVLIPVNRFKFSQKR